MKKLLCLLLALGLLASLAACGKHSLSVVNADGRITVEAENADTEADAGRVAVAEGQALEISAELSEGGIRVQIFPGDSDDLGEPLMWGDFVLRDQSRFTLPAGEYLVHVAASEGATGKLTILPLPAETVPSGAAQLPNPWREISADEARALCPPGFAVPEDAQDVRWNVMEAGDEPLVQLDFRLYDMDFTARCQRSAAETDISGLYYDWIYQLDGPMRRWGDGSLVCHSFRTNTEEGWIELCTWYDPADGASRSLCVAAPDLDGFDLQAIAEALAPTV